MVVAAMLALPATTRQGVDYTVTTYRIPTYVKAIDFLHRHHQYQLLVSRICAGETSDRQCLLALLDWTHANIRPAPTDWPIVDDHPLHIVIRGYGADDQMADVFTTLATYAGIPSFFKFLLDPSTGRRLVLTFAHIGTAWAVLDVEKHVAFRRHDGGLASVDDLVMDPRLVDSQTEDVRGSDVRYSTFVSRGMLLPFTVPDPLHGELQQPLPRLRYEARRVLGLGRE
jgi:hypothetical protein